MTVIGDPRPSGQEGPAGDQRAAGEEGPAGDPRQAGEASVRTNPADTRGFDPSAHTVEEVNAYLDGVGDNEKQRVLNAEKAGKNRVSIVG